MMTKKEKQNFYFVCASLIDLMHDLIEEQKQGKDNKTAILGIGFALDHAQKTHPEAYKMAYEFTLRDWAKAELDKLQKRLSEKV